MVRKLLYPNKIKKNTKHDINYSNRGMNLENLINEANNYYLNEDIAIIYKKPTPIKIGKVNYEHNKVLVNGVLNQKSTLDYVGLYKGKYLDFDAKSTLNKTSFPLSNVHPHQIKHMRNIHKHGGITFLIIEINNNVFIITGEYFLSFIDNEKRKSIPYKDIEKNGHTIKYGYNPVLDYLNIIDKVYFKEGVFNE